MNINATVAEVAMVNHGLVCRRLLRERGLSGASIDRWLANSSAEVIVPGVYRIFTAADGRQPIAAAVMTLRVGVADLHTAASLHGFPLGYRGLPQVVVPHGGTNRSGLASVRQTRDLNELDVRRVDNIPSLTLARTICELAAVLSPQAAARFVTQAIGSGKVAESEVVACDLSMARQGRPGVKQRRQVLDPLLVGGDVDLTVLERTFLERYVRCQLPTLEVQFAPPWFDGVRGVVDFARPSERIIIEVDGRAWHSSVDARLEDARRDRRAQRHGWIVYRFGWDEVVHRWSEVEAHLRHVIAAEGSTPA